MYYRGRKKGFIYLIIIKMLQLIINQTNDRETMILSSVKEENTVKKVFVKNDVNWDTKEWVLYSEITKLLEDYLK